jgi:hypothetical protein
MKNPAANTRDEEHGDSEKKTYTKWPHLHAELYGLYLNKVAMNFHLIIQYSPVGTGFRHKLNKHKNLMSQT